MLVVGGLAIAVDVVMIGIRIGFVGGVAISDVIDRVVCVHGDMLQLIYA